MPTESPEAKTTFWQDFLGGLAGPSQPTPPVAEPSSDLVEAAKIDVIARFEAGFANLPDDERKDCEASSWASLRVMRSVFNAMAAVVASGQRQTLPHLYESIEKLAGPYADQSPAFQELGRFLGISPDHTDAIESLMDCRK